MMSGIQIAIEIAKGLDVMNIVSIPSLMAMLAGMLIALAYCAGYAIPVRPIIIFHAPFPVDVIRASHPGAYCGIGAFSGTKAATALIGEKLAYIIWLTTGSAYVYDNAIARLGVGAASLVAIMFHAIIETARKQLLGLAAIITVDGDLVRWVRVLMLPLRLTGFIAEVLLKALEVRRLHVYGRAAKRAWLECGHLTPPIVSWIGAALFGNSTLSAVMTPLKPIRIIPQDT